MTKTNRRGFLKKTGATAAVAAGAATVAAPAILAHRRRIGVVDLVQ